MTDHGERRPRSEAARQASRRNGAKSKGPKTAAGKHKSAMNALKHGLRSAGARAALPLPPWAKDFEEQVRQALVPGLRQGQHLDQVMTAYVLAEAANRHILAETARIRKLVECGEPVAADEFELLRKLVAYRRRFRATRDAHLRKAAKSG